MLYLSTRGHADRKHFCDILLEGLAPDGGLYLPEHYPQVDDALLTRLRKAYHEQGYAELAFQILSQNQGQAVTQGAHTRVRGERRAAGAFVAVGGQLVQAFLERVVGIDELLHVGAGTGVVARHGE